MATGGFHPHSRLEQDLAEGQVGVGTYRHLDAREDGLIENLLGGLKKKFAGMPHLLAQIAAWEAEWRDADKRADQSVSELGDLFVEAERLVQATA